MTNTNKATALIPSKGTSVAKIGDSAEVQFKMNILRSTVPGMSRRKKRDGDKWGAETGEYLVSDELCLAMVVAEANSGLSAARNEIYAIPGIGLQEATKVTVADAMTAAVRNHNPISVDFELVPEGTPMWEKAAQQYGAEPGDTVAVCRLSTYMEGVDWRQARMARMDEFRAAGIVGEQALDRLDEELGKSKPVHYGFGIVKATEKFDGGGGGDDDDAGGKVYDTPPPWWKDKSPAGIEKWKKSKADKAVAKAGRAEAVFSRYDRARKRALKRTLNAHGLSAPSQRNYGAAAKYMVKEDAAGDIIASAISVDDEAATLRRAELEAELTAQSLVGPRASPEVARRVFGSDGGDGDLLENYQQTPGAPPPPPPEDPPEPTPAEAAPEPPAARPKIWALNAALDFLMMVGASLTSKQREAFKSHIATTGFRMPADTKDPVKSFKGWIEDALAKKEYDES